MNSELNIPAPVRKALYKLMSCEFEAFLVGGCVRDFLLSKTPYDFDITTNAFPDDIILCFNGYPMIKTGISHGTVTVCIDKTNIEITTYRIDGDYRDNRHPDHITFTASLAEDLKRRDFTINAFAYNESTGIVDLFNGQTHLKEKIICCVGDSDKRFEEDALRILRALRFASALGFRIEEKTALSIHKNKKLLNNISKERIYSELSKLILGESPSEILLSYSDILIEIIPELAHCEENLCQEGIKALSFCPKNKMIRFAALLYALSVTSARSALNRLKADNFTIKSVIGLLTFVNQEINPERTALTKLCANLGFDGTKMLLFLKKSLILSNPGNDQHRLAELENALAITENLIKENACISLNTLAVNGRDIINAGVKSGTEIGKILNILLSSVISGEIENKREMLINKIDEIIRNQP